MDKNKKILKSNFTINEQNLYFKKQIINEEIKEFHFMNKKLKGISNGILSFLEETDKVNCKKENIPNIIIEALFLKDIFIFLLKNNINRNFNIKIENNELKIIDILTNEEKKVKTKIYLQNKQEFIINSNIFYIFKLNLKTITSKSIIYIWDNQIVYENNRKKKTFYYLFKI